MARGCSGAFRGPQCTPHSVWEVIEGPGGRQGEWSLLAPESASFPVKWHQAPGVSQTLPYPCQTSSLTGRQPGKAPEKCSLPSAAGLWALQALEPDSGTVATLG